MQQMTHSLRFQLRRPRILTPDKLQIPYTIYLHFFLVLSNFYIKLVSSICQNRLYFPTFTCSHSANRRLWLNQYAVFHENRRPQYNYKINIRHQDKLAVSDRWYDVTQRKIEVNHNVYSERAKILFFLYINYYQSFPRLE